VKRSRGLPFAAAAATLLVTASVATASSWHIVARASDSSEFYASASITKAVRGALKARLTVRASAVAQVRGSVGCIRTGSSPKHGTFRFSLQSGTKVILLPLRRARCKYFIGATLKEGGLVRIALGIYK
jgi:hypothetical protein